MCQGEAPPSRSVFYEPFLRSLEVSIKGGSCDRLALSEHWFREQGKPYFFLFKKNLHVTNIQFGELIALVRTHLRFPGAGAVPYLRFVSHQEFLWSIKRLQETFDLNSVEGREQVAD